MFRTGSACEQEIRTSWSCSQAASKPIWHIPLLCVQWKTPDDGQRNCPKHVEFYSKSKFEKLVHLVGFIIRTAVVYVFTHLHVEIKLYKTNLKCSECQILPLLLCIFIKMECSTQKYQNFTKPTVKTFLFKNVNLSYSKFLQTTI